MMIANRKNDLVIEGDLNNPVVNKFLKLTTQYPILTALHFISKECSSARLSFEDGSYVVTI